MFSVRWTTGGCDKKIIFLHSLTHNRKTTLFHTNNHSLFAYSISTPRDILIYCALLGVICVYKSLVHRHINCVYTYMCLRDSAVCDCEQQKRLTARETANTKREFARLDNEARERTELWLELVVSSFHSRSLNYFKLNI